jgi:hypothetical protein
MTKDAQTIVVALMLSGIAVNLIGVLAMTIWRKPGVTIGDLVSAGSSAAAHPKTYVKQDRVRVVRILYLTGTAMFLTGVLTILALGLLIKA